MTESWRQSRLWVYVGIGIAVFTLLTVLMLRYFNTPMVYFYGSDYIVKEQSDERQRYESPMGSSTVKVWKETDARIAQYKGEQYEVHANSPTGVSGDEHTIILRVA